MYIVAIVYNDESSQQKESSVDGTVHARTSWRESGLSAATDAVVHGAEDRIRSLRVRRLAAVTNQEQPPTEIARPGAAGPRQTNRISELLGANRRFRLLWASNLFYFAGVWMQTLVLGWLVFDITNSATLLALFAAIRLSPMFLGPLSGVLADRLARA